MELTMWNTHTYTHSLSLQVQCIGVGMCTLIAALALLCKSLSKILSKQCVRVGLKKTPQKSNSGHAMIRNLIYLNLMAETGKK